MRKNYAKLRKNYVTELSCQRPDLTSVETNLLLVTVLPGQTKIETRRKKSHKQHTVLAAAAAPRPRQENGSIAGKTGAARTRQSSISKTGCNYLTIICNYDADS